MGSAQEQTVRVNDGKGNILEVPLRDVVNGGISSEPLETIAEQLRNDEDPYINED